MSDNNIRVLFVDDEVELAELAAKRLEMTGHSVTIANNATIAMQKLVENRFDVVVSDINMPGASGFDFLELSSMSYGLPVILISGNLEQSELDSQGQVKGAFASLPKPFQFDELESVISKAAEFSRQSQEQTENTKEANSNEESLDQKSDDSLYQVLLVEDEEILLEMLSQVLRNKLDGKIHLETAVNGLEATEKIKTKIFDCIITDLQMPQMGGAEFLQNVVSDENYIDSRVIVVSAYSQIDIPTIENLVRFDKPVRASEIINLIEQYISEISERG